MKLTQQEKTRATIMRCILGSIGVFILAFIGTKLYPLIHGPQITIDTLSNGETVRAPMIRISGKAAFTRELSVNGEILPLSPSGVFDEKLLLNPGYNLITVTGTDRYGKTNTQSYAMILSESPTPETLTMNNLTFHH